MASAIAATENTSSATSERRALTPQGKPNLRPWAKGQSGNPGGRPAGLAKRIREATADGEDLVTFMVGVLKNGRERTADRIAAATWLADRSWGRPQLTVELRADEDSERHARLVAMTPEQRAELRVELLRRLEEETRGDGDAPVERAALPPAANGPVALPQRCPTTRNTV